MAKAGRRYHPQAASDLAAAVEYYDGISEELGNRFRAAVRRRLDEIAERPEVAARIHDQLRAVMIHDFPYVILYRYDPGVVTISISGIFHASSDQDRWFQRTL